MSIRDNVNKHNLIVARVGGVCETHHYLQLTKEVDRCTECGMQRLHGEDAHWALRRKSKETLQEAQDETEADLSGGDKWEA